jgi:hypothetical protein
MEKEATHDEEMPGIEGKQTRGKVDSIGDDRAEYHDLEGGPSDASSTNQTEDSASDEVDHHQSKQDRYYFIFPACTVRQIGISFTHFLVTQGTYAEGVFPMDRMKQVITREANKYYHYCQNNAWYD